MFVIFLLLKNYVMFYLIIFTIKEVYNIETTSTVVNFLQLTCCMN